MDERALFDPGPLRTGRTSNLANHLLDQELDAGSPSLIGEDPHVFEAHQGPDDLARVSDDEGVSGKLAHTTTLEHLRQFRGTYLRTPLRFESRKSLVERGYSGRCEPETFSANESCVASPRNPSLCETG